MTSAEYQVDVKRRGWIYLSQLPPRVLTTVDGKKFSAPGAPGARSPWSPNGSRYEIAPLTVRIEEGFNSLVQWWNDTNALENLAEVERRDTVKNVLIDAAEATGLDHGVPGVVAKALGIPPWLLLVVLALVAYAMLQQARYVPPISKVLS